MDNIDITLLKQYKNSFDNENQMFEISSYNTFLNCYLNSCNDPYIKIVTSQIDTMYKKIIKDFNNINKWWTNYIDNIYALENYLSDNQGSGYISENIVRNYVQRNLIDLSVKQIDISNENDFEEYK